MMQQTHDSLEKTAFQMLADKADLRNHIVVLAWKIIAKIIGDRPRLI
jgi:hypothetical protein